MSAGLSLLKLIDRTPSHHVATEVHEVIEDLGDGHDLWLSVDDRQIDDTERRLHRGHLKEVIEHDFGHHVAAQFHHHAHTVAV